MESCCEVKSGFQRIKSHILKNINLYIISFLFVTMGIIIGAISVKHMTMEDRQYALNWISESINSPQVETVKKIDILIVSIKNYIPMILCIWFLGLTVVGSPFVLICNIIKGYSLGYSFFFMVSNFGRLGVLVGFGAVVMQNLFYIPGIMEISVNSMEFSLKIIREKNEKVSFEKILRYSFRVLFMCFFMFFGCLIETFLTPQILKLLLPYL